jgi:calcineurin-like phosphoesterase family protein
MTLYVTSDLHFGHEKIIQFCPNTRPYKDANHMNEMMIAAWNSKVTVEDTVYILGDIGFSQPSSLVSILNRLNGEKILIVGNHDAKALKNAAFRSCFKEIHEYLKTTIDGQTVIMFHYPIYEWDQLHRGSIHLYGHVHGHDVALKGERAMDVGVDSTGMIVSNLHNIIKKLSTKKVGIHHENNS